MSRATQFRRLFPVALAALLASLAGTRPLQAGTVYVPFAVKTSVDGIGLQTDVWLTNSTGAFAKADVVFIPLGADGTKRDGVTVEEVSVRAGTTVLYDPIAKGQAIGLLEITLPDGVFATARLVGEHPLFGAGLGTEVPVVTSRNLATQGQMTQVQGWTRTAGGVVTDFGLVNLSHQQNSCRVSVFRAGGGQVQSTVLLSIQPLSMLHFADALGILGETATPRARAEVECDKEFYPYSLILNWQTGETTFLTPSGDGSSSLVPPGQPPAAPPCPPGAACFEHKGNFFTPSRGNPVGHVDFPVPPGRYRRVELSLDITHGGWWPKNPSGRHNIFWLVRNGNPDLFGFLNVSGPNSNAILLRHGFGQRHVDKPKLLRDYPLQPGRTYTFEYNYDTREGVVELIIRDTAGQQLFSMAGPPDIGAIDIAPGDRVFIEFGFKEGHHPQEHPTYGWAHSNMTVRFLP